MPYLAFFYLLQQQRRNSINFQESGILKPSSYFMPQTNKQYSLL